MPTPAIGRPTLQREKMFVGKFLCCKLSNKNTFGLTDWLRAWLTVWLIDWLTDWFIDCLVDLLIELFGISNVFSMPYTVNIGHWLTPSHTLSSSHIHEITVQLLECKHVHTEMHINMCIILFPLFPAQDRYPSSILFILATEFVDCWSYYGMKSKCGKGSRRYLETALCWMQTKLTVYFRCHRKCKLHRNHTLL